jgi:hypothetical protein
MPHLYFTPMERTLGTHWIGCWVGCTAGLDKEARRKILCPYWESNSGHPVHSQTLYWVLPPRFVSDITSFPNKYLAIICKHISVPYVVMPFFHYGDVFTESFSMSITHLAKIEKKKSNVNARNVLKRYYSKILCKPWAHWSVQKCQRPTTAQKILNHCLNDTFSEPFRAAPEVLSLIIFLIEGQQTRSLLFLIHWYKEMFVFVSITRNVHHLYTWLTATFLLHKNSTITQPSGSFQTIQNGMKFYVPFGHAWGFITKCVQQIWRTKVYIQNKPFKFFDGINASYYSLTHFYGILQQNINILKYTI